MQYRKFGKTDFKPSALGFGCMRLPVVDDKNDQINEELAIRMIRDAVDQGVNYIDTAWPYHGKTSEPLVGKALRDGYRERVKLATKLPSWLIEEKKDLDSYFDEQLKKLETDYIDFYLLHSLNEKFWQGLLKVDVFDWVEKKMAEGKIKHIGFSFHDSLELFKEIVDYYDSWDFCQIQYNYLDTDYQAGIKGLKYAADRGLAVVIMEPLRGGRLAVDQPDSIKEIWEKAPVRRTPADWALQWLWNQEEVSLVLSGMSAPEQVNQNIESANNSGIGQLSAEELSIIEEVRDKYHEILQVDCTGCRYCLPCPNGVMIPDNFELFNEAYLYDQHPEKQEQYLKWTEEKRAVSCVECNTCVEHCPQNIEIPAVLTRVAEYFRE